jgi:hypothetical protein
MKFCDWQRQSSFDIKKNQKGSDRWKKFWRGIICASGQNIPFLEEGRVFERKKSLKDVLD